MGGVHSRRGSGPAKVKKHSRSGAQVPPSSGYIILGLIGDRVKVVNGESPELSLVSQILRRHSVVLSEGRERHLTWSYHLAHSGHLLRIQIVADILVSLFKSGWEPMTPVDGGLHIKEAGRGGPQVTICFKLKEDCVEGSAMSLKPVEASCLCLETYGSNYLGFHNVSNTILHEIVTSLQGVVGVSMGVSSVISDYTARMPPILARDPTMKNEKYIQLAGHPWTSEDVKLAERIQMCLIASLIKEGYKVCMDVNIDATSRVFFFIKKSEDTSPEVLVPDMQGISIGKSNRPKVLRSKSSFFRSYAGRGNSMKKRVRVNVRKRVEEEEGRIAPAMTYKPRLAQPAWWQQTSTDIASDQEDL
jgi:hypothetical protein